MPLSAFGVDVARGGGGGGAHPAQSQHANHWAARTRKQHQQERRPQRPTERSDLTQHAKGRTRDLPGPRKGATTRWNVTRGGGGGLGRGGYGFGIRWLGQSVGLQEKWLCTTGKRDTFGSAPPPPQTHEAGARGDGQVDGECAATAPPTPTPRARSAAAECHGHRGAAGPGPCMRPPQPPPTPPPLGF